MLGLSNLGIKALALTSITPKEQITSMYQQMESDKDVRLVYGELSNPMDRLCFLRQPICSEKLEAYVWSAVHMK